MVTIGSNEIFVDDTGGDKPALLFVHGIMMDHSVWHHQVAAFSSGYRVVRVDLRGYGKSPADDPDISFEDHAEDLAALIDKLGLRDVTLIGWSMGGAIAQVFAHRHGSKIKRIVMVDTTPQLLADDKFPHALPVEGAQQLGGLLVENFAEGCAAFCGMISPESDDVAAMLTEIAAATRPEVALMAFQSSGGRNQLSELSQINTPTWVIAGANDAVCMPAANTYLADAIPGCTTGVHFIDDAGHAPFLTKPDAFNAALRDAIA